MESITWESWRIPLLVIHVLCVAGAGVCCGGILLGPQRLSGRLGISLLWVFLLGSAITGGMLYPAFETRILWEKLGYAHGLGERLFRVKVHLAVVSLALALLLPRISRAVSVGQVTGRWPRLMQQVCIVLVFLTLLCTFAAEGVIRYGGAGS